MEEKDEQYFVLSKEQMKDLRKGYPHRFPGESFAQYVQRHPRPLERRS